MGEELGVGRGFFLFFFFEFVLFLDVDDDGFVVVFGLCYEAV